MRSAAFLVAVSLVSGISVYACGDPPTVPSSPAQIDIVAGDFQTGVVGTELPEALVVRVVDRNGIPVSGQLVNFVVTSGGGSVFVGPSLSNDSGFAQDRWTLGTSAADSQRVEVRAVDPATGEQVLPALFSATALAGPPASLEKVSEDSQTGVIGSELSELLVVRVADQYDNDVPGVSVAWTATVGGGDLTPSSQTDGAGLARAAWILGTLLDVTHEASAAVEGVGSVQFTASPVLPSTASLARISGDEQTGVPSQPLAESLVVTVALADGRPAIGVEVTWAATAGGAAATVGVRTDSSGGASTEWVLGASGVTSLVAEVTELSPVTFTATGWVPPLAILAAGDVHNCGLTADGAAFCWGGYSVDRTAPEVQTIRPVAGGLIFVALASGGRHNCALVADGTMYCWGHNRTTGAIGDGSKVDRAAPVEVQGGLRYTSFVAGGGHTCGLVAGGIAYCWGDNQSGAVGDGTNVRPLTPTRVTGGLTFTSLTAGHNHTCGVTPGGAAYCWGDPKHGRLGVGWEPKQAWAPLEVAGGITFAAVMAGGLHTCGLTFDGTAYCWGDKDVGQVGDGTFTSLNQEAPAAVIGGLHFGTLVTGFSHTCGLTADGTAHCWGSNPSGQLGDGTTTSKASPVEVLGGLSFAALVAGWGHVCGLTAEGTVYCWGNNSSSQFGDGTQDGQLTPVAVPWMSGSGSFRGFSIRR